MYDKNETVTCSMSWCELLDKNTSKLTFTDRVALHLLRTRVSRPHLYEVVGDIYTEDDINTDSWLDIVYDDIAEWVSANDKEIKEMQKKYDREITRAYLSLFIK